MTLLFLGPVSACPCHHPGSRHPGETASVGLPPAEPSVKLHLAWHKITGNANAQEHVLGSRSYSGPGQGADSLGQSSQCPCERGGTGHKQQWCFLKLVLPTTCDLPSPIPETPPLAEAGRQCSLNTELVLHLKHCSDGTQQSQGAIPLSEPLGTGDGGRTPQEPSSSHPESTASLSAPCPDVPSLVRDNRQRTEPQTTAPQQCKLVSRSPHPFPLKVGGCCARQGQGGHMPLRGSSTLQSWILSILHGAAVAKVR